MHVVRCIEFHESLVGSPSTANLGEDVPLPAQANLSQFIKRQSHLPIVGAKHWELGLVGQKVRLCHGSASCLPKWLMDRHTYGQHEMYMYCCVYMLTHLGVAMVTIMYSVFRIKRGQKLIIITITILVHMQYVVYNCTCTVCSYIHVLHVHVPLTLMGESSLSSKRQSRSFGCLSLGPPPSPLAAARFLLAGGPTWAPEEIRSCFVHSGVEFKICEIKTLYGTSDQCGPRHLYV